MTTVLLDLALILVLARIAGWVFVKIGMPAVVGEILAGVLLGPSLLGDLSATLFPLDTRPFLSLLANMGLVLFMFVVGLELDVSLVRGRGRVAGAVSVASIVFPFGLGIALAWYLAAEHNESGQFWPFALFIGASMSVTAFPVLARILTDRNMHRTETGGLALACAAVDDVLAWTLLAVVIAISPGAASGEDNGWVVALAIPFALLALLVIRPQLNRLTTAYNKAGRLTPGILAVVLVGLLAFSATTEILHVHFIFGAFLFGAIIPQANAAAMRHEILVRLEQISVLLLLPVFFLVSGLNVDVRGLGGEQLVQLALILAVAVGGKYLGAYAGARLSNVPPWQARSLGILMNTRGLTELVILNVGRELELIGDDLFTMLVIMALVTTMMTGPLLRRTYPDKRVARDIADAERAALGGDAAAYRALVVADPQADNLDRLEVALALVDGQRPAEVVVASLQPQQSRRLDVGSGLTDELAAITESMERLERLVRRGAEVDVPVKISSRLSSDPAGDLLALIDAVEPQMIVLASRDQVTTSVAAAMECLMVITHTDRVVSPDTDGVAVTWRQSGDEDAAVVVACRIAAYYGLPLHLAAAEGASSRRFAALSQQLTDRGVDVRPSEPLHPLRIGASAQSHVDLAVRAEHAPVPVDWASQDLGSPRAPHATS